MVHTDACFLDMVEGKGRRKRGTEMRVGLRRAYTPKKRVEHIVSAQFQCVFHVAYCYLCEMMTRIGASYYIRDSWE